MQLFNQILIGWTIAGVSFIRKKMFLNPLFLGDEGRYADCCVLFLIDGLYCVRNNIYYELKLY